MYIYNPFSLAVQLHLQPSVLSQSAPWLDTNSSTGGFYAHHNVAELTLCLWLATATVQHCCHILRPQHGHKNTREEEMGHEKKKTRNMIDGFLWSYFLPPQNGWLPTTYGCLSNWGIIVPSVHTWQGTYAITVPLGWIYNLLCQKTKCFFCLQEGRCNYFCNVCLGFSV